MSHRFPNSLAGKLSRYLKRLKAHMSMVSFTGRDSISILSFLKSYKISCDHFFVNEDLSVQMLPYVLESSPKQMLIAYMRQRNVSYPKFVNFLLYKYASNETIMKIQDAIKNLQQLPNERASDFADYVLSRTKRCCSAYGPINQIEIFIHGIAHHIREHTTRYCSDHPDIYFESLARFCNGLHYSITTDSNYNSSSSNRHYKPSRRQSIRSNSTSSARGDTSVLPISNQN